MRHNADAALGERSVRYTAPHMVAYRSGSRQLTALLPSAELEEPVLRAGGAKLTRGIFHAEL